MKAERRFLAIIIIGVGSSLLFYSFIGKGLIKYSTHRHPRLKEILTSSTRFDVLFVGSSRTHTTIFPRIVDSIAGLTSYNAGTEGGAVNEFKLMIDAYLLYHPSPKMIVLTIDPFSLDVSSKMFDPTQYLPFIEKNRFVRNVFIDMEKKTETLQWLPFLRPFIYMDDYVKGNAIKGWMGRKEIRSGEFENKGFLSNGVKCIDTLNEIRNPSRHNKIDQAAIQQLEGIIDTCRNRNIKLMITYAPEYRHKYKQYFNNFNSFEKTMNKVTAENGLVFFRDDSLSMNVNPCYFLNYGHTNLPGSIEYSKILGQRINEIIKAN